MYPHVNTFLFFLLESFVLYYYLPQRYRSTLLTSKLFIQV